MGGLVAGATEIKWKEEWGTGPFGVRRARRFGIVNLALYKSGARTALQKGRQGRLKEASFHHENRLFRQ